MALALGVPLGTRAADIGGQSVSQSLFGLSELVSDSARVRQSQSLRSAADADGVAEHPKQQEICSRSISANRRARVSYY